MSLVRPHGAARRLQPLLVPAAERQSETARAATLRRLPMSSRETSDLIMLGIGAFTPLRGFMGAADWRRVCDEMRLADGTFWPIPITVSASEELASAIAPGEEVALADAESGEVMGTLVVEERCGIDRAHECRQVFRTDDPAHPGVAKVMEQGPVNLAGPVRVLSEGHFPETYPDIYLRPHQTRALFESRGWSTVAAFQTRNPMHRAHEYLAKVAIEVCDGLLVHQLLGKLKDGDIPAEVRVRCIDTLVDQYFVPGTCVQAGYPMEMRYAGPREALLHAVFRQNYGCSHLVVGRDHAGVGKYYGPLDAQRIFDEIPADALELRPLRIEWTFFCSACDGMASSRTCPHGPEQRLLISGTRVREMLSSGEDIDPHFSRPEVLAILREYYAGLDARVGAGSHAH
ncbi:MAG TPA: sulfate adenylyltransferase [Candidatus Dormibacteraeota bacterium]|nr:sulfate adenylyltransferase [Candidatus Dormibacteraeota bacterium]